MPTFREKLAKMLFSGPYSISDPALAEFLGLVGVLGGEVSETKALGLTAVYRAQALIAGTIAGLPLKVYADKPSGLRKEVNHFLTTSPAGPYDLSPFSWTEMLLLQMLNHGEAFLKTTVNGAGAVIGLWPIHPSAITKVEWVGSDKRFTVAMADGSKETYLTGEIIQVLGLTTDGLRGMSPLTLFRESFQTSRAGDKAANRTFTAPLIAGLVSTDEDVDATEAKTIKENLQTNLNGPEHAGDIAFVNRALKFSPWSMTAKDAQYLESRSFQVQEVARIYGVPPHLLSDTDKTTSWGSGIQEQDLALAKYTLMGWTGRIESALQAILPPKQHAEFVYAGLLAGTPKDEIELLIAQVTGGILTADEARAIRNMGPMPKPEPVPVVVVAPDPAVDPKADPKAKPPAKGGKLANI